MESDTNIIRLSEATNLSSESLGLTPSVAFKFLVDNRESVNLLAMSSFLPNEGHSAWNFFGEPMKNFVADFSIEDEIDEDEIDEYE